jgi:hypothetical protein
MFCFFKIMRVKRFFKKNTSMITFEKLLLHLKLFSNHSLKQRIFVKAFYLFCLKNFRIRKCNKTTIYRYFTEVEVNQVLQN